jgi:hypothetical protein
MRSICFRTMTVCLCVSVALLVTAAAASAQALAPNGHLGMLTDARVSTLASGRIVVSMEAGGDLPGLMTITLDKDAGGAYVGQWALVVAFVEDLNPDGTVATTRPEVNEDPLIHEQHHDRMRAVRRGTLSGAVVSATLRLREDGGIAGVDFAQLSLGRGSLTFVGVTGNGVLTTIVTDGAVAGNSLSLTF